MKYLQKVTNLPQDLEEGVVYYATETNEVTIKKIKEKRTFYFRIDEEILNHTFDGNELIYEYVDYQNGRTVLPLIGNPTQMLTNVSCDKDNVQYYNLMTGDFELDCYGIEITSEDYEWVGETGTIRFKESMSRFYGTYTITFDFIDEFIEYGKLGHYILYAQHFRVSPLLVGTNKVAFEGFTHFGQGSLNFQWFEHPYFNLEKVYFPSTTQEFEGLSIGDAITSHPTIYVDINFDENKFDLWEYYDNWKDDPYTVLVQFKDCKKIISTERMA